MDCPLPPGQRVAELPAGGERRRAGRQDLHLRESVGADLEDAGRVSELMNLVENHHGPVDRAEEDLRVADHVLHGRQVAVHVERSLGAEALGERGLPAAADPAEPRNRGLAPRVFDSALPEGTFNHAIILYIKAYQMYSMVAIPVTRRSERAGASLRRDPFAWDDSGRLDERAVAGRLHRDSHAAWHARSEGVDVELLSSEDPFVADALGAQEPLRAFRRAASRHGARHPPVEWPGGEPARCDECPH